MEPPSLNSATTTCASVLDPRLMVKAPAMGQHSLRTCSRGYLDRCVPASEVILAVQHAPHTRQRPVSVETTSRMRQHGIDLAGVGDQIGPHRHLLRIILSDVFEQSLEFGQITLHGLPEVGI